MMTDTKREAQLRRIVVMAMLLLGLGLIGIMLLLGNFSPPLVVEASEGGVHISFSADHRVVPAGRNCVMTRWTVEGIQAVFIDNQPTVGSDQREVCISPNTAPTLRVILPDGSSRDYSLPVRLFERTPLAWILAATALALLLSGTSMALTPGLRRLVGPIWPGLRKALRLAGGVLAIMLVALVTLELGLRFYFTNWGTQEEKVRYLYSAEDINRTPQLTMPLPYVNYGASPNYPEHNRLGYRGADIDIPKPEGVFRIVALGGSTTYSSGTTAEEAYPSQLQRILREQYGYAQMEVVNGGLIGYTSWDTLANFIFRVVELEPDMVIIFDGVNDITPRMYAPDCYRGFSPIRGLNPYRFLYTKREYSPLALYRVVGIAAGWMVDPTTLDAIAAPYADCQREPREGQHIYENAPVYFERNLRSLIAVAQANSVQVMFSTWVYNTLDESPSTPDYWRYAVDEHNAVIRRLAAEFDLPLYDLAKTDFPPHYEYWDAADPILGGGDPIHMSAAGAQEQARLYAAFLADEGLIPPEYGES